MLQLLTPRRGGRTLRRLVAERRLPAHPGLNLLVERGLVKEDDAQRLMAQAAAAREPIPVTLARSGLVSGHEWARLIADHYGLELAAKTDIPEALILEGAFSSRFLRQNRVLPLAMDGEQLWLGMADPADEVTIKAVRLAAGREVVPVVIAVEDLDDGYARLFEGGRSAFAEMADGIEPAGDGAGEDSVEHLLDLAQEAPVVRLVNQLLSDALRMKASDIHIEPYRDRLQVRYRIHGKLREIGAPPARLSAAVISRIKILAKLDIAERRLPQDGRVPLQMGGRRVDLRVATIPTIHGESLVIRLLDSAQGDVELSSLGLASQDEARLRDLLSAPHGMLLVTGPTGSGKTTTLYAALRTLDAIRDKIVSIEDPIEYQIGGVTQVQVKPEIDLTFARVLRSVVRHDPNIIMVGETRDGETADIAVHAALTGHLLLSTLHTNSAAGAVARLLDMEVEPYLLASVLRGVVGQRLVGILCDRCKAPYPPGDDERHFLRLAGIEPDPATHFYKAAGCRHCNEVGFTGRVGIFELLRVTEPVRRLIRERASTQDVLARALAEGMTTMYQDGLNKALAGVTTFDEVRRVTDDG
ncbi:MAG: type II/IV secretion system protein [Geminicoccaceae bacterium]|nr:type II/IV secretion system protein [Geminicoccaceae bacterium]